MTPAPIGAIWDAGGIDTIDTSGFATTQLIDLHEGSLTSIGGVTYDTAPSFAQVNANRAAAGLASGRYRHPHLQRQHGGASRQPGRRPPDRQFRDRLRVTPIENAIGGSGADTISATTPTTSSSARPATTSSPAAAATICSTAVSAMTRCSAESAMTPTSLTPQATS